MVPLIRATLGRAATVLTTARIVSTTVSSADVAWGIYEEINKEGAQKTKQEVCQSVADRLKIHPETVEKMFEGMVMLADNAPDLKKGGSMILKNMDRKTFSNLVEKIVKKDGAKSGAKSSAKRAAKSAAPKPKPTAPMNDNGPKASKPPKAPQDPHTPRQPQKPKKAKDSGGDGQKTSGPERTAKDPEWKKQEGQEWKDKIVGKAQKTGTSGHARKSYEIAIREAKKTNTKAVYLNKGYNKATGEKIKSNRRPDVTVVKKDGKVNVHEVESKTDNPKTLRIRNEEAMGKLPKHMQGTIDIVKPD